MVQLLHIITLLHVFVCQSYFLKGLKSEKKDLPQGGMFKISILTRIPLHLGPSHAIHFLHICLTYLQLSWKRSKLHELDRGHLKFDRMDIIMRIEVYMLAFLLNIHVACSFLNVFYCNIISPLFFFFSFACKTFFVIIFINF